MITIDSESKLRKRFPFEIDNMAERYKTENGYFTFTTPSLITLERNYFYLLKNSTQQEFQVKYLYKPAYLSYDAYGVINLGYLLMYINNVQCIEDFNLVSVIIPSIEAITRVCQDTIPQQTNTSKLTTVNM